MSANKNPAAVPPIDADFLITQNVGGPHTMVERAVTIDSVPLPETNFATVERIQISEKVTPLPPTTNKADDHSR
jgi:hypothetical protein